MFRNTSSSDSFTTSSLASRVDFAAGVRPDGTAIGDLDGDGKPDVVAANDRSRDSVSIFRNTSSSGNITSNSFATKMDFTTGVRPDGVAIGDLDGDGKPDIVTANNLSNTVSVLRNSSSSTGFNSDQSKIPTVYSLDQNYPNPFNPSTNISFSIPSKSFVSLKVFDALGREVAVLVSEELPAGTYSRQWNATQISSGVYFYRLQADSFTETKKLVLLR